MTCLTAVLAFGISSCSDGAAPDGAASATSASSTAVTAQGTPSALAPATANGIPIRGVTTSSKGAYLQTTMDDSDPAWNLDPAIIDPATTSTIEPSVLLEGYRHILTFIAEEAIDSPVNGGGQSAAEWWAEHAEGIADSHEEELRRDFVDEGRPFIMRESWQQEERFGGAYEYVYDSSRARLLSRVIKPASVWKLEGENITIAVQAEVDYSMAVRPAPGTTSEVMQHTTGPLTYSATKDPLDGKWRIDGYAGDIRTTEAW